MKARDKNKTVTFSEKVFRRLLAAYPKAHREEFGEPMAQLFRDQCRDAWNESRGWGLTRLWLRVLPDLAATSFAEHLESIKERKFMVNQSLLRSTGVYRFLTVFTLVLVLVVVTATVITFMLPETYSGTARVLVRRTTETPGTNSASLVRVGNEFDPYFIQTECEVMQSELVLERVIENLDLNRKWAGKLGMGERLKTSQTLSLLKATLELRPVKNSYLIEIRTFADKPDEAAMLANAVAATYQKYRLEAEVKTMIQRMKAVQTESERGGREIHDLMRNLESLRTDLKVVDNDPQSTKPQPTLFDSSIQQLQLDLIRVEGESAKLERELNSLSSVSGEKLRDAVQIVAEPDSVLSSLQGELDLAEQQVVRLRKTVTENHPDYRSAQELVERLNKKIDGRVEVILFGLKARISSSRSFADDLRAKMAEARKTDLENVTRTQPYWEAKQKLAERMQYQNALQMKVAFERADLQLPKQAAVEIIDRALPNPFPARPNKPLNIAIGVVLGIVLGLIAAAAAAGISFISRRNAPPKIAS